MKLWVFANSNLSVLQQMISTQDLVRATSGTPKELVIDETEALFLAAS